MNRQMVPYKKQTETGLDFSMELYLDDANCRLRVDDYRGSVASILKRTRVLAEQNRFTKIIVKAKSEHWSDMLSYGYMLEGILKGYYNGCDAYMMTYYLSDERERSDFWIEENNILQQVREQPMKEPPVLLPEGCEIRIAQETDIEALSQLYAKVFEVYPTPMDDPSYVQEVMADGTVFYVITHERNIVSAASAEINAKFHNAEMTDCATLPDYRKHGFMKILIAALENELRSRNMYCSYSLCRALSFGINAVFHQLRYAYTGRMTKNCNIFDKYEDMNIWVKHLV